MAEFGCKWRLFVAFVCYLSVVSNNRASALTDPQLPAIFYPFGTDQGDRIAPINDDGYTSPVPIAVGFPFFNSIRRSLYVNTNGAITFDSGLSDYTPDPFPIYGASLVAVYWSDVDTTINKGRIYYRETNDNALLERVSHDVQSAFSSQGINYYVAKWLFISTWHNVTYYGGTGHTPIQSFQIVLTTDGTHSFALYHYGELTWTYGTASQQVPAQVGFNAGDAVNYYAVPWSRTSDIVLLAQTTNVDSIGRWAFRIDSATIIPPSGCAQGNGSTVGPVFECPSLTGPTVVNRMYIEFYCSFTTNSSDTRARFEIRFTFDGQPDSAVPPEIVSAASTRATLHEKYLNGRLGKWLACQVISYFVDRPNERSVPVKSLNSYRPVIEASTYSVAISEDDVQPARLTLLSTLPITCQTTDSAGNLTNCQLKMSVYTTTDIAVRQRYPGKTTIESCTYVFNEADWKQSENKAYNTNGSMEITSKLDSFATQPRQNVISFTVANLPDKYYNGQRYPNPWSNYEMVPVVYVYRYDTAAAWSSCTSSGDPRIDTLDDLYYSTYATGQFIYVQSSSGLPVEAHVRHWPCSNAVSCVCGVALREETTILAADMCTDGLVHYITYDAEDLPPGAGIFTDGTGYTIKIQMPSGNKALIYLYSWGMNIDIQLTTTVKTVGLCGNRDGNPSNDLTIRGTGEVLPPVNGQAPDKVVDSWRIPQGQSLFDGYLANLTLDDPATYTRLTFCMCETQPPVCGGPAVVDNSSSAWEPNTPVTARVPLSGGVSYARKQRSASAPTDNLDYSYNSGSFRLNSTKQIVVSWPTPSNITHARAEAECTSRIFGVEYIGPNCYGGLSPANITGIIQKCVDDVQISDDFSWATDKIPELQQWCIDDVTTANYTELNDTTTVTQSVVTGVSTVTAYSCSPADCSGHGTCSNGTCVCTSDYIGTDCAVSKDAVPSIVQLMDPADCNIRTRLCESAQLQVTNVTNTVVCRTYVDKAEDFYPTSGQITSLKTLTCSLPIDPLSFFSNRANFSSFGDTGHDFDSIPTGAPVLVYKLAVTNNGRTYSAPQTLRVIDTLCMSCVGETCTQKTDTCLINGYCFASGDTSPYDNKLVCEPSSTTSAWTSTVTVPGRAAGVFGLSLSVFSVSAILHAAVWAVAAV